MTQVECKKCGAIRDITFAPGEIVPCGKGLDRDGTCGLPDEIEKLRERYSGGSNDYYKIHVAHPTSGGEPYTAECNDIIEALNLNYAEATVIKAVWRISAWRRGLQRKAEPKYDAEKIKFFAERILAQQGRKQ